MRFKDARTTIYSCRPQTQEFSLDFQDLDVSSVRIGGRSAQFEQVDATATEREPDVTQPIRLVVKRTRRLGRRLARYFRVDVRYSGTPEAITDADGSMEGWIAPATRWPLRRPVTGRSS